jgi:hypothetical protein
MKVLICPFSLYQSFGDVSPTELHGANCIYSNRLQNILLNVFVLDKENEVQNKIVAFYIKKILLFPTYIYSEYVRNYFEFEPIIVSDEYYTTYFIKDLEQLNVLNLMYNLPVPKQITLKRTEGNFPKDDSIEFLLTRYFEESLVVNLNDEFKLRYVDEKEINQVIRFRVTDFILKDIPERNITSRFEEMRLSIELNQCKTYEDCESFVYNYHWFYYKIDKEKPTVVYVRNQEVSVDFEVSEPPPRLPIPEVITGCTTEILPEVILPLPVQINHNLDDVRKKRLEALSRKQNIGS